MFDISYRPTDDGLVPRLEFDVILAVYCDYNHIGYCDYPTWNLLTRNDMRCDAIYNIIEPLEYNSGNGTQEFEDFHFDTIYGNEISQPAAFEQFFENFGVWQDGDPDYEEPRELIGVNPDILVHNEDGKPAVFWEEFTDAVMSSREFKGALEWGVQEKINDLFDAHQEWNLEITGACPDGLKPWNTDHGEVFFTAKIYREYPVVKP